LGIFEVERTGGGDPRRYKINLARSPGARDLFQFEEAA
jgi:hypothetical protein